MSSDKMLEMQMQIRQNADDMKAFISDLNSWEKEMKEKEPDCKQEKIDKSLPPIRNKVLNKKLKQSVKTSTETDNIKKNKKIKSWDYKAWEKFDVDKACEEMDEHPKDGSVDEEDVEDEDEEKIEEDLVELVNSLKEKGNDYFKKELYNEAIECYTKALNLDSNNSVLYSNRALCLLKQEKWIAAEEDCGRALNIDQKNVKALFRRGLARKCLKKFNEAKVDFMDVVRLEPFNKLARVELDKLNEEKKSNVIEPSTQSSKVIEGLVLPIEKPLSQRSKKPLKRIKIEEIGMEDLSLNSCPSSKPKGTFKNIKDEEKFETFLKSNSDEKNLGGGMRGNENLYEQQRRHSEDNRFGGDDDNTLLLNREIKNIEDQDNKCLADNEEVEELDSNCEKNKNKTISNSDTRVPVKIEELKSLDETMNVEVLPSITVSSLPTKTSTDGTSSKNEKTKLPPSYEDSKISVPSKSIIAGTNTTFPAPTTSFHFHSHWKILKNKDIEFFNYFKEIKPSQYRHLFGESFEYDMLHKIITILHSHYTRESLDPYEVLFYLTTVKRFSMLVMFLAKDDKILLKNIFKEMQKSTKRSSDDINQLMLMYEL